MRTIFCPTDFSQAANNAIGYAAQLAKFTNARLEIINVQYLVAASPVVEAIEAIDNKAESSFTLQKICNEINDTYQIECNYRVEITEKTLEKMIVENTSGNNNLILMGTNGADDLYQYVFGTYSYQVIKKANCPVLVIPENVSFAPVKKVVLTWDYTVATNALYEQLNAIYGTFHPQIHFVHISREKTDVGDDVFRALQEGVYKYVAEKDTILFNRIYTKEPENFASAIDNYVTDQNADALAIIHYDRGKLKNVFHGAITKELCETAQYPLLVLPHEI